MLYFIKPALTWKIFTNFYVHLSECLATRRIYSSDTSATSRDPANHPVM